MELSDIKPLQLVTNSFGEDAIVVSVQTKKLWGNMVIVKYLD